MAHEATIAPGGTTLAEPAVRRIGMTDLREALAAGLDDFRAMPSHLVFLCIIYPVVGLILARLAFGYDVMPLVFPLVSGFALIGPFAAIGLYELSRRRERGQDVSWRHAFDVFRSPSIFSIGLLGLAFLALLVVWLGAAEAVYALCFGNAEPVSVGAFADAVFTTRAGWALIVLGNAVGFLFAVVALILGAVSFPLLVDRDVGPIVAVRTSARAVLANPLVMAVWGLIVAAVLALGSLPLFVGLAIAMPVLGHSTWHLYRRLVER